MNANGSTFLDDVAHYMYTHDMVGYQTGFQNVITYTVGFMGDLANNLFLINTSNNGNGNPNLYDTGHPDYGKYHFSAESPDDLTSVLLEAVNSILSQNMIYTAPVVPVTKTMSGNKIYLAFFKPLEGNFWEGNIVKLGIDDDLEVVGKDSLPATWPTVPCAMMPNTTGPPKTGPISRPPTELPTATDKYTPTWAGTAI